MKEPISLPFKHPKINAIVSAAFPGAKTRRPVRIECRTKYHVADYWDGGSRYYCAFVQLSTMQSVTSDSIPKEARQQEANPFNLPVADVLIQPGYVVVEHIIFCGKDFGYRLYVNADDIPGQLPEATSLIPLPPKEDVAELPPHSGR